MSPSSVLYIMLIRYWTEITVKSHCPRIPVHVPSSISSNAWNQLISTVPHITVPNGCPPITVHNECPPIILESHCPPITVNNDCNSKFNVCPPVFIRVPLSFNHMHNDSPLSCNDFQLSSNHCLPTSKTLTVRQSPTIKTVVQPKPANSPQSSALLFA